MLLPSETRAEPCRVSLVICGLVRLRLEGSFVGAESRNALSSPPMASCRMAWRSAWRA